MENSLKLSIVIPVYNVEKYLSKNLDSLINQTYHNIEIICVNDGSTDGSLDILNAYKNIDERIKIINNKNHGVSYSRNVGIDYSTGDYIAFVDGDDYVDEDYAFCLLKLIDDQGINMGISLNHHIDDDFEQEKNLWIKKASSLEIINNIYMNRIYMAVWNKIYSLKFLHDYNIKFDETLWYAEGMHFNIQCLVKCKNVCIGNKRIYHYRSNPNSAMRRGFNLKNEQCALKSLDLQRQILLENGISHNNQLEFHYLMVSYMILNGILKNSLGNEEKEAVDRAIKAMRKRRYIPLFLDMPCRQKIWWCLTCFFPVYMTNRNIGV